jgi:hypothetical protein
MPNDNMNPAETPSPLPPPTECRRNDFQFEPLPEQSTPLELLGALLKHPGQIIHELHGERRRTLGLWLLLFALIGMALYGLVVGSLTGGTQLWIAPVKLALGTLLSVLICLPSLYIFSCLGGNDVPLRTIAGALGAAVCLSSLLLIGFAPVAWIFSQSTDSTVFMGVLHLCFWLVGLLFGLRLIGATSRFRSEQRRAPLKLWSFIFLFVCLQMTTTLRPIIGHSDQFLPREKKFFLAHWFDSLGGKG